MYMYNFSVEPERRWLRPMTKQNRSKDETKSKKKLCSLIIEKKNVKKIKTCEWEEHVIKR